MVAGGTDFSGHGNASGTKPVDGDDTGPEHGTSIAAFAAGRGHGSGNKLGIIGSAPAASVLSVSTDGDETHDAQGVRWLVDHGAKVISLSFGSQKYPVFTAAVAYAEAHDVVVVAASGNGGGNGMGPPASYFGVMAVAGVDKNLASDPRSVYGSPYVGTTGPVVDYAGGTGVVGPFSDNPSTSDEMVGAALSSQGSYQYMAGTSYSAPVVAGIVALIRAKYPTMNAANVIKRLLHASQLQHPKAPVGTWTAQMGFGVPNAYAALTANVTSTCENPLGSINGKGSYGIWSAIEHKTTYKPSCTNSPSSAPSSSASSAGSAPASQVSSSPAAAASSRSSGTPAWVWIVIVVAVLLVGGLVALLLRRRGGHGGGGPGGPPPGGGGYPQGPPGGYPPRGAAAPGPPPPGWQQPGYGRR